MARKDGRGRTKGAYGGERFIAIPNVVLETMRTLGLSPVARAALMEVASIYDGSNNGFLAMSARVLAERLGVSKDTSARALRDLVQAGLLDLMHSADFDGKQRKASEYRLTFRRCNRTNKHPPRRFLISAAGK